MDSVADRYIDLVKHAVNGDLHGPQTVMVPVRPAGRVSKAVKRALALRGILPARSVTIGDATFATGVGWPESRANVGESMIGLARLSNVQDAVESVIRSQVPGDLIEAGVWRGGAAILMRAVLVGHGVDDRVVYVADSFEGLPPPTFEEGDAGQLHLDHTLAVSLEDVRASFQRYGLLDDQVRFIKGWFRDTLPALAGHSWSVIRLDGDMYESTRDGLVNLYPGLSPGGWLIVDDYHTYESCRRAVDEYRREHRITEPISRIDDNGVFWRKE